MARKGLGRGLSTLLGEQKKDVEQSVEMGEETRIEKEPRESSPYGPSLLPASLIDPNPYQPRVEMDAEGLDELTQSVRNHGILEPLLVRRNPDDPERFQLIAGERRLRAARNAGLDRVPALVREAGDLEMMEIAIVENVQRENLNPIDEAEGYRRLIEASRAEGKDLSQDALAQKVGKNRTTIANLFRLLDLPDYVQDTIKSGVLSQGHGKILAGLDAKRCKEAWNFILKEGASVRALEKFLKPKEEDPKERATPKPLDPGTESETPAESVDLHLRSIEEALGERLRAKVKVVQRRNRTGTIQISFFDNEELTRILESMDIEL